MDVRFTKMEGAGNDYVYVDAILEPFPIERAPVAARVWSDRHFGIGADGLILLLPSRDGAVRMAMWNADGSRGAMCGNGLRCVAKLAHDHGHVAGHRFAIETDAGTPHVELVFADGVVVGARTGLTDVVAAERPHAIEIDGRSIEYFPGDAGNPHAVIRVADLDAHPVQAIGSAMQGHAAFPGGVNVEFVVPEADGGLRQRTFERGSGETLACGSGAAVAALTAMQQGWVPGPEVPVRLLGGTLTVALRDRALVIEGPARTVFHGFVPLP